MATFELRRRQKAVQVPTAFRARRLLRHPCPARLRGQKGLLMAALHEEPDKFVSPCSCVTAIPRNVPNRLDQKPTRDSLSHDPSEQLHSCLDLDPLVPVQYAGDHVTGQKCLLILVVDFFNAKDEAHKFPRGTR